MAFSTRHTPAGFAGRDGHVDVGAADPRLVVIASVRATSAEGAARHCAFIAADVAEVMRPLPIEPVPGVAPFVLGLSIIRGAPTPVLDAAAMLGEPRQEAALRHARGQARFVVMRVGERRVALDVDSVVGVRALAGDMLHALPPLLRQASETVVAALGTHDSQLLTVLAGGAYLLPPAVLETLAAAKAPA